MDKNMINIDDLIKQRLTGGEEKERPGAWLAMRELLDDQMPTRVAGGFNWRRMFTILSGAALLTAATVGGYKMYSNYTANRSDKTLASNTNIVNNAAPATGRVAGSATNASSSNSNNSNNHIAAAAAPTMGSASTGTRSASSRNYSGHVADNKAAQAATTINKVSTETIAKRNNSNIDKLTPLDRSKLIVNKYKQYIPINTLAKQDVPAIANASNAASTDNAVNTLSSGTAVTNNSNVAALNPAIANSASGNSSATSNNIQPASGTNNVANNNITSVKREPQQPDNNSPKTAKLSKDSINMIATKESYSRKNGFKLDTIDKGKVAKSTTEPADDKLIPASSNSGLIAAATATKDNKEGQMLPLSQFKVSSKKTKGWESSRFEEMVKNAKFDFSKVSFYPGIVFGVASSFGENSVGGFQVGLTGTTTISEHWSVLTELKFREDFNMSGNVIEDNYNTNGPYSTNPPAAHQITYQWDYLEHNFTFTTLSSIHMPVAVKYSIARLNMFFGADLGYNFAVNYTEPGSTPHRVTQTLNLDQNNNPTEVLQYYEITHDKPSITKDAFGARLGIGALLGVSYNITPATSIDLRYAQNVWDSKQFDNKTGASIISDKLFNRPSLQFNISYRFSNNKYRIKTYHH